METRRVEITEERLKLGRQDFVKGDVKTFDKDIGDMIVDNGWGKDADTGETGDRKPGAKKLKVDGIVNKLEEL